MLYLRCIKLWHIIQKLANGYKRAQTIPHRNKFRNTIFEERGLHAADDVAKEKATAKSAAITSKFHSAKHQSFWVCKYKRRYPRECGWHRLMHGGGDSGRRHHGCTHDNGLAAPVCRHCGGRSIPRDIVRGRERLRSAPLVLGLGPHRCTMEPLTRSMPEGEGGREKEMRTGT